MSYEPLHHKYRPQTFADLVGQETISLTLTNALQQEKIAPAYLFTGPRGTGKTSSARILAKSLNCLESSKPTSNPCGRCEVCKAIAKGRALDVLEIDAASNTGVDNIREIIERSRFAPVQCRYKVYAIDECLTGDSLVQTSEGLMRIDNPNLKGKKVLSYNEDTEKWEYKKVLRWLKQGTKKTLIIKTGSHQIRCTENHLIRTKTGWIEARNVKEGMKILSPVNVGVEISSTNMVQTEEFADLQQDTRPITTSNWEQNPVENGYQICNNIQSPQWTTNLERVESVNMASHEQVYDLEVEDHHNFVANGLLVHNCHMLSTAAFNALLKTLEEPPPSVVFILATTDPQRVLSTIISRCQRFDYRRIPLDAMVSHLKYIASEEKIAITDEATTLIAQIANGGLRDAESLLDQLSLLPETISVEKVWDLVGAVPERDLLELLKAIRSAQSVAILQQCRSLLDRGREPLVVLQNLASFYLNLLIAKAAPQRPDMVAVTETCWQELCAEATNWDMQLILHGQQHLKEAETQLRHTTQPRLWLEVTLLGLLPSVNAKVPVVLSRTVTNAPLSLPEEQIERSQFSQTDSVSPVESPVHQQPVKVERSPESHTNSAPHVEIKADREPIVEATNSQSPALNNLANEEIWQKVVGCLQPLTQALLRQHCHLISLEGGSAIVGISSKELRGLHQGKVSHIEIAFEKVCQRKIKVQLEVETPNQRASKKPVSPNNNPAPTTEMRSQNQVQGSPQIDEKRLSASEVPPDSQSLARSSININEIQNESSVTQTRTLRASATQILEEPKPRVYEAITVSEVSVLPLPLETEFNISTSSESVVISDIEQDYPTSYLQQAIDNLTQSFEGELVQLDDTANKFMDSSANSETLETKSNSYLVKESLDAEKTIKSCNQISPEITTLNRPNLEEYDDEW